MQNVELQNLMSQKPRYEFIDLAKGICIILVVHLHIVGGYGYSIDLLLTSFRMPLYFILSGMFFSLYGGFSDFLIKKTNKLLIPFLSFLFLSYIIDFVWSIITDHVVYISIIYDFNSEQLRPNGAIWFLFCLFVCGIIFYLIVLLANKFKYKLFLIVFLSLLIGGCGFVLYYKNINLPLWIDSAMTAIPFYAFGYLLRKYSNFLWGQYQTKICIISFVLSLLFTLLIKTYSNIRSNDLSQTSYPLYYLGGFVGTMAILFLCKGLNRIKYISFFGRYSICILVTHLLINSYVLFPISSKLFGTEYDYFIVANANCIILFVLYIWIIPFMLKYMPYICAHKDLIKLKNK